MFIAIRKYRVRRGLTAKWAQRVRDGFVPLMREYVCLFAQQPRLAVPGQIGQTRSTVVAMPRGSPTCDVLGHAGKWQYDRDRLVVRRACLTRVLHTPSFVAQRQFANPSTERS
jgi:hypothetical protein